MKIPNNDQDINNHDHRFHVSSDIGSRLQRVLHNSNSLLLFIRKNASISHRLDSLLYILCETYMCVFLMGGWPTPFFASSWSEESKCSLPSLTSHTPNTIKPASPSTLTNTVLYCTAHQKHEKSAYYPLYSSILLLLLLFLLLFIIFILLHLFYPNISIAPPPTYYAEISVPLFLFFFFLWWLFDEVKNAETKKKN